LYEEQDEKLWDQGLINEGLQFLIRSAQGTELSSYHLEAKIAYWHSIKDDTKEKWEDILSLYDQLLLINFSPAVALNRIYAYYKVHGSKAALEETKKLQLDHNHFYFLLLAELYKTLDKTEARRNLEQAWAMAKTETEKLGIQKKMDIL
jgi:RNA polymerase sigma-70 factor (ECF subfamily)